MYSLTTACSLTHSLTYSLTLTHLLTHHTFTHSLIHSLTHSLTHLHTHSHNVIHSHIHSFTHSQSLIPPSPPPSLPQDSVCILLLQFSSLLVENAYAHIHDSNNKKQGAKLRRLMTFAWPCLLPKQCVVSVLSTCQILYFFMKIYIDCAYYTMYMYRTSSRLQQIELFSWCPFFQIIQCTCTETG